MSRTQGRDASRQSSAANHLVSAGQWWPSGETFNVQRVLNQEACLRAVLGLTRHGKGQWLKTVIIPALLEAGFSVVCIDVDDEYSQHGKTRPTTSLGPLKHRVEAPDFENWLSANKDTFLRKALSLSIVPVSRAQKGKELAEQIEAVLPWVKDRGGTHLVLEEVSRWGEYAEPLLQAVATGWLKEDVSPWFVAQGLSYLPLGMRRQLLEVYSFKQVDSADINFLATNCARPFALEVLNLDRHHFVARDRSEPDPSLLEELAAIRAARSKET